jgi:hypothetical protein
MPPMDVIKAATANSADALGIKDLGTLAVGKTADFVAMPNNPLEKMSNIKDIGVLYVNGNEQERTGLIQNIHLDTGAIKVTEKEKKEDEQAEAQRRKEEADAKLEHYGSKFPLGKSQIIHGVAIPTPKDSKVEVKGADRFTVSIKASAADLRDFYAKVLPRYKWTVAGNCWEHDGPSRRVCVDTAANSAAVTVTEK